MPDLDDALATEQQRARFQAELRDELVQVAAVAMSAINDLDYGKSHPGFGDRALKGEGVLKHEAVDDSIYRERVRQLSKWGQQHHDPVFWLAILGEEFGEACQSAMRLTSEAVRAADLGACS